MLGFSALAGSPLADIGFSAHVEVVYLTDATTVASETVTGDNIPVIRDVAVASFTEILETDLIEVIRVFNPVTAETVVPLVETATASELLSSVLSVDVAASAQGRGAAASDSVGSADIIQTALIRDATLLGYVSDLSAGGAGSDLSQAILLSPAFFSERPRIAEALSSQLEPGNLTAEGALASDNWFSVVLRAATTGDVLVGAELAEALASQLSQEVVFAQTGQLADSRSANTRYQALLIGGGRVAGVGSINQILRVSLRARGHATTTLLLDPRYFEAWVINTDSGAVSRYLNMPFNSATWYDRRSQLLLAKEDGIYVLDPAMPDDEGLAIEARIRTGLTDFGSSRLKRVHSVSLGLTAQGTLVAKAVVTEGGQKDEHWYQLEVNNRAPAEAVIPIGQGLNARYWGLEIANQAGADFEIDAAELYPVGLSRRKVS